MKDKTEQSPTLKLGPQNLAWTDHLATNQKLSNLISKWSQCGSAHFAEFITSRNLRLAVRAFSNSPMWLKKPKSRFEIFCRGSKRVSMWSKISQQNLVGNARHARLSIRWLTTARTAKKTAFFISRHPTLCNLGIRTNQSKCWANQKQMWLRKLF